MTDAELAELLRSVIARPDDLDVLRVYADCLIERGDVRGELIVVQLQRRVGDSPALVEREAEVASRLEGALAVELGQPGLACAWRRGFLDAVDFSPVGERRSLADSLRLLGTLPSARQVRRIVVRLVEPGWGSMGQVLSTLARIAPQLRALRELVFTASPREEAGKPSIPAQFGDLAAVCRAIPKLEVLEIAGADYATMRDMQVTSLRRLVLEEAAPQGVGWLAAMRMPALEELEIHGSAWRLGDLEAMLSRETRVRHLALVTTRIQLLQRLCRDVPASRLFATVRTFELGGSFDKTCLEYLLHHVPLLRRLERFTVVDGPGLAPLRDALREILVVH